ncbi:glycosyltransferase family 39 protein [Actinoallomurus sp. NPDC050550]|uniref:glycosyltransferase family 39 protein n=1 Tax=Actinoallomurus sp. NPDC050550 TaxID=3154937 RepID=UPI00340C4505
MTTTEVAPAPPLPERHGRVRRLLLGPPDEQVWARPVLWAILALAAVLYGWSLSIGNANGYYTAAVLSGTKSWKAFFFGSLDAGSYITVDKPPMSLWVMGLSARAFGFNAWSILLPQAIEGVATVAVLYAAVRRAAGTVAGLIAALALTLTPMVVAINRDTNPDTLLVLLLVVAAWACLAAIDTGRAGYLVLCGAAVGCAFNTKMLQAFVALPALALVYLLAAQGTWFRRIGHLLAAGIALAASGLWWLLIVDLIPANHRPYVGSSRDGTVLDLVIGYNGAGRLLGDGGGGPGGAPGLTRMFNHVLGAQISWLLPFVAITLAAGLIRCGRRPRTDLRRASLTLWGSWLAVHYLVLSFTSGNFHPYYSNAMAPAIGALTGIGVVALADFWAFSPAIAASGAWSLVLLRRTPYWLPWLPWAVAATTGIAVVTLVAVRFAPRTRVRTAGVALGLAAVLAGPAAYAMSPLYGQMTSWRASDPLAGPSDRPGTQPGPHAIRSPLPTPLVASLMTHQDGATWLVAVPKASFAYPLIIQTGRPVIAIGGFTGKDNAMTLPKLQGYITTGRLHYLLLDPTSMLRTQVIAPWVQRNCTMIESGQRATGGQTLYRCDAQGIVRR